jgi:hypothetical protein
VTTSAIQCTDLSYRFGDHVAAAVVAASCLLPRLVR